MILLIIADDESVGPQIPDCTVDMLVSCGDLPDELILKAAARCHCRQILAVKGNHDSSAPFPEPIRDLDLKSLQFRGMSFGGFCGSWKYKPRGNYLFEDFEVEHLLASFPAVDVFIAHNSPRDWSTIARTMCTWDSRHSTNISSEQSRSSCSTDTSIKILKPESEAPM